MSHAIRSVALAAVLASALVPLRPAVTCAQGVPTPPTHWEMLASSGALIPTGDERRLIKDAPVSTLAVSFASNPRFALTTTIGWARTRDRASAGDSKLDVFTYDIGAEARAPRWLTRGTATYMPFMGIGAGGRSYRYRSADTDARHNLAGYGAVGGELGRGRVHLRLELRDYVAGFKSLRSNNDQATRNDVIALVGLRIAKHAE